jgi:hypothetical protein
VGQSLSSQIAAKANLCNKTALRATKEITDHVSFDVPGGRLAASSSV